MSVMVALKVFLTYYQTAKTRTLYESTDAPTGQPAANPPDCDGFGDFY